MRCSTIAITASMMPLLGLLLGCGQPAATPPQTQRSAQRAGRSEGLARAGSQTRPADRSYTGKGCPPPRLPADAVRTMDRFREALEQSDYSQAITFCSQAARNAARQRGGAERFLRTVVPIEELIALTDHSFYSFWYTRSTSGKPWLYGCFLKLSESRAADPPVNWEWSVEKTEDGWIIDFPPIPLQEWIGMEQTRLRRRKADHEARRQALQAKLPGVTTRLSCDRTQYRPGEPVLLKLALVNGGKWELSYDDQQAAVNRSVVVTRADGQVVRWIGTYQQTNGACKPIHPGETAVLFSDVDITRDYDMRAPGRYRIQFTGHGLSIGEAIPRSPGMPEGAIEGMPSNVIEVAVR